MVMRKMKILKSKSERGEHEYCIGFDLRLRLAIEFGFEFLFVRQINPRTLS